MANYKLQMEDTLHTVEDDYITLKVSRPLFLSDEEEVRIHMRTLWEWESWSQDNPDGSVLFHSPGLYLLRDGDWVPWNL